MSHNKTLLFVSNACQGFANLLLGLTSNIKKRMLGRQKHSKKLMGRNILTKSVRKFLRRKKSEIRRQFFDAAMAEEKIRELVEIMVKERRLKGSGTA